MVDRTNRTFFALVGLALVPYVLIVIIGCGFVPLIVARIGDHGFGFLTAGPGDLRPGVVAVGVVTVGTVRAVTAFVRQAAATRALERRIQAAGMATPRPLSRAAERVGIRPERIDAVDAAEPFSFTYGLVAPRVAVSQGLVEDLGADELDAVLLHEHYHLRNFDPLKIVLARVLSAAYFFLPVLRGLRDRYGTASELAADRRAVGAKGKAALASALATAVRGPGWRELSTSAAIGGPELLEVRVAQLESGREPPPTPMPAASVLLTAGAVVALGAAVTATFVSLGGAGAAMREVMGSRQGGMGMDGPGWPSVVWGLVGAVTVGAAIVVAVHQRRRQRRS